MTLPRLKIIVQTKNAGIILRGKCQRIKMQLDHSQLWRVNSYSRDLYSGSCRPAGEQSVERHIRLRNGSSQQRNEILHPRADHSAVEQLALVIARTCDPGRALLEHQRQPGLVDRQHRLPLARDVADRLHCDIRQVERLTQRILQSEIDLEQRSRVDAFLLQMVGQNVERQLLPGMRLEHALAHAAQGLRERQIRRDSAADDHRVLERTHDPLRVRLGAIGHGGRDQDVGASGPRQQQGLEAGEQAHEQRGVVLSRIGRESGDQVALQAERMMAGRCARPRFAVKQGR